MVLNADQQLVVYNLKLGGKKGKSTLTLEAISSLCLYLDEIIDVRIIEESLDDDTQPKKALICSNNEFLKVVDLDSGNVI